MAGRRSGLGSLSGGTDATANVGCSTNTRDTHGVGSFPCDRAVPPGFGLSHAQPGASLCDLGAAPHAVKAAARLHVRVHGSEHHREQLVTTEKRSQESERTPRTKCFSFSEL